MSFDDRYISAAEMDEAPSHVQRPRRVQCAYVRLEIDKVAYYIRRSIYKQMDTKTDMGITQHADYAVNLATNSFIKCRHDLDTLVKAFTMNLEER